MYVYTDKQENSTRKWVETVPGYYRVDSLEAYCGCFESVRYPCMFISHILAWFSLNIDCVGGCQN